MSVVEIAKIVLNEIKDMIGVLWIVLCFALIGLVQLVIILSPEFLSPEKAFYLNIGILVGLSVFLQNFLCIPSYPGDSMPNSECVGDEYGQHQNSLFKSWPLKKYILPV